MSSLKEQFDAATNVIQSLPKKGSFQPSTEMQLTFYSLFKQATVGSCNVPKPAFYDIVGRTKWEAWNHLKNVSKEEAMRLYINELKKIVEVMPQTEVVRNFIEKIGKFYVMVDDDGEDYDEDEEEEEEENDNIIKSEEQYNNLKKMMDNNSNDKSEINLNNVNTTPLNVNSNAMMISNIPSTERYLPQVKLNNGLNNSPFISKQSLAINDDEKFKNVEQFVIDDKKDDDNDENSITDLNKNPNFTDDESNDNEDFCDTSDVIFCQNEPTAAPISPTNITDHDVNNGNAQTADKHFDSTYSNTENHHQHNHHHHRQLNHNHQQQHCHQQYKQHQQQQQQQQHQQQQHQQQQHHHQIHQHQQHQQPHDQQIHHQQHQHQRLQQSETPHHLTSTRTNYSNGSNHSNNDDINDKIGLAVRQMQADLKLMRKQLQRLEEINREQVTYLNIFGNKTIIALIILWPIIVNIFFNRRGNRT